MVKVSSDYVTLFIEVSILSVDKMIILLVHFTQRHFKKNKSNVCGIRVGYNHLSYSWNF